MKITAQQIADIIGGQIEGDPNVSIDRVVKIDEDEKDGLTFLANPKYEQFVYTTGANVVIVSLDFKPEKSIDAVFNMNTEIIQFLNNLCKENQKKTINKDLRTIFTKNICDPIFLLK